MGDDDCFLIPRILFHNTSLSLAPRDVLYNLKLDASGRVPFPETGLCLWRRPLCRSSPARSPVWGLLLPPHTWTRRSTGCWASPPSQVRRPTTEVLHRQSPTCHLRDRTWWAGLGPFPEFLSLEKGEMALLEGSLLGGTPFCSCSLVTSRKDAVSTKTFRAFQKPTHTLSLW